MNRTRTSTLDAFGLRDQRNRIYPTMEGSDGSIVSLDFTTGFQDSRLTFQRAAATNSGVVTYVNSAGLIAAATTNEPRLDYDPITLTPRGLLIEGSATNLLTYSQFAYTASNPPTGWTSPFTGGPGTVATSIWGSLDGANAWSQTASSNRPMLSSTAINVTSGTTYTASMYLEAVSGLTYADVFLLNAGSATLGTPIYRRNGTTVSSGDTAQTGRIEMKVACTGSGTINVRCGPGSSANCTGSATFSRPQVEASSAASSYIGTGASASTRAIDYLKSASSSSRTEFSLNDLTANTSTLSAYTVLIKYGRNVNSTAQYPAVCLVRSSGGSNLIDIRDFSGTTVEVKTSSRSLGTTTVNTNTANIALAVDGVTQATFAVNGTATTPASGTIDSATGLEWVQFGNSNQVAGVFNPIWVRQFKVWNTRLSSSQMQNLTS